MSDIHVFGDKEILLPNLQRAVALIKQWHNFDPAGVLTKAECEKIWAVYFHNAPEMRPIKEIYLVYNLQMPEL